MGRSTVNKIFRETCEILWQVLKPLYLPEPTEANFRLVAEDFWKQWNFPMCLGAIDGKHVLIKVRYKNSTIHQQVIFVIFQAPNNAGSLYFNYKGTHSIVLLAVVDANYCFTYVDIGAYGSQSDSGIFAKCEFGKQLLSNTLGVPESEIFPGTDFKLPFVFIGDEAFPLSGNLMRPFPGKELDIERRIYNYRHCR